MSQVEENIKQFDEMLENTNFDYLDFTYSPIGEEQGLLEEMFDVVSTPEDDAMGTLGMAPQDERFGELSPGLDLCQKFSPFPPHPK